MRLPKFRTIHHLLVVLAVLFVGSFVYHEKVVPYTHARRCEWPVANNKIGTNHTNVLLVADPQLIDNHTYPGRNPLLLKLSQHTVDVYIKKNYRALVESLEPDYIFFLGDLLDNGRSSEDDYFLGQVRRFERIFSPSKSYVKDKNVFYQVPGNHDIGWADGVNPDAVERFTDTFGNPNSITRINNVDFVTLDTLSLSSKNKNDASRTFLNGLETKSRPRVLLSHVPFYRDTQTQTCGPYREGGTFRLTKGYQYQTALDPELSLEVLNTIQPDVVFSGDDHDYCDIHHTELRSGAREITVKSISMAMGIKYPAVQLLLIDSGTEFFYNTDICYLPTPYVNIAWYVVLLVVSGLLILWWNAKQRLGRYNYSILPTLVHTAVLSSLGDVTLHSNTRKISKFLDEDLGSLFLSLPRYTFTEKGKSSKFGKSLTTFVKRWNVMASLKHSLGLGVFVAALYYLVSLTV